MTTILRWGVGVGLGFFVSLSFGHAEIVQFGMGNVLERLNTLHGDYRVRGKSTDGSGCEISVLTAPNQFRFTFNDNLNESEPLEVLTLLPTSRMVSFDYKTVPASQTLIKMRDRVAYRNSSPREVDVTLMIEDYDDGKSVYVLYEDKIKKRRFVCMGPKTPGLAPEIYNSLKCGQALSSGRSMYE